MSSNKVDINLICDSVTVEGGASNSRVLVTAKSTTINSLLIQKNTTLGVEPDYLFIMEK